MNRIRTTAVALVAGVSLSIAAAPSAQAKDKFCPEMTKLDKALAKMNAIDPSDQAAVYKAFASLGSTMKATKGVPSKIAKPWKAMADGYTTFGSIKPGSTSNTDGDKLNNATTKIAEGSFTVETWSTKACGVSLFD